MTKRKSMKQTASLISQCLCDNNYPRKECQRKAKPKILGNPDIPEKQV